MIHRCPACGCEQSLEESWPKCCRVAMDGTPAPSDPQCQATGDFRHEDNGPTVATHDPANVYYFACTRCGAALDRSGAGFSWVHRRPEQVRQRNWSFRVAQMGIAAIDPSQIVADWVKAVADPEAMTVFNCDRRAMPESTAQKISDSILDRARRVEVYDMAPRVRAGCSAFAGLDTGRRCWFFARERQAPDIKRVLHAEQIALGNLVDRTFSLCQLLGIETLFIDQAPATDEARTLALRLNGSKISTPGRRCPTRRTPRSSFPAASSGAATRKAGSTCAAPSSPSRSGSSARASRRASTCLKRAASRCSCR